MTLHQLLFLLILGGGLYLFASEKLRVDLTAMLILLALVLTGSINPKQALSGFSSEPAIILAAVFVISGGLAATGITERIGHWIGRMSGGQEWRTIAVVMPTVAALSAFTHHVMVTAMMMPILIRHARTTGIAASRLLMPMALAASLGTTLTLVSAPAFLLADNMLQRADGKGLGIFSITPIGITMVLLAMIYMQLARWFLPKRTGEASESDYLRVDQYRTELLIVPGGRWATRTLLELKKAIGPSVRVLGWLRDGAERNDLTDNSPLLGGDVLLIEAGADELQSLHEHPGLDLLAIKRFAQQVRSPHEMETGSQPQLIQGVVAPSSEFIGHSIRELEFAHRFQAVIAGVWRRSGSMAARLSDTRLRSGDLLVLWGLPSRFNELASNSGFLMLVPFRGEGMQRLRAPMALAIMVATVIAAATEWLDPPLAFLAGAVAMVVLGCVDVTRAYRQIDVRIFVMIAGVIPLGIAMEQTGTAALLAGLLMKLMAHWSPLTILMVLFAVGALFTQPMSDAATTALLGPIALSLAQALHLPPAPFVVCTALGAVVAFLTPIGHHGSLLILGPGQYKFSDFLRIGLPLTIIAGAVCAWMARWLWLGGPLLPG